MLSQRNIISPMRNSIFTNNDALFQKAQDFVNYDLMKWYKNESLAKRLDDDLEEIRKWADIHDEKDLKKFLKK